MGDTFKIKFLGYSDSGQFGQQNTQPSQAEVVDYRMHESGKWIMTVCAKSGQVGFFRIADETDIIIIDRKDNSA
jgi:hypothetical protein